jgi:hypothetical protein
MRRRRVATTIPTNRSSTTSNDNHTNTTATTTTRTSCLLVPKISSSTSSNDFPPEQSMIPDHNNNQPQQSDTASTTNGTLVVGDTAATITNSTLPSSMTTETTTTTPSLSTTPLPIVSSSSLSSPLSVTIISQNTLPSYSSERFYLLSELEIHAASTVFLSSSLSNDDHSTQATEEESFNNMTLSENNHNNSDDIEDELYVDSDIHGEIQNPESNPIHGSINSNYDNTDDHRSSTLFIPHTDSSSTIRPSTTVPILTEPLFLILYILWKPNMTNDPQRLIQDTILAAMIQIQQQYDVDIIQSSTLLQNYSNHKTYYPIMNGHSSGVSLSSDPTDTTSLLQSPPPPPPRSSASIYIVVDRIVPRKVNTTSTEPITTETTTTTTTNDPLDTKQPLPEELDDDDDDDDEQQQYCLVERVGRAVASHVQLRDQIDGITIGISDHVRAAPGLELCIDAITKIGNIDRRRFKFQPHHHYKNSNTSNSSQLSSSNGNSDTELAARKSLLSIVAMSKGDLLGLQHISNTDAADCVQQSTVTAEWYGQGDIYMFASRAHFVWKQRYNVLIDSENAMDGIHGTIPTSDPFFRKRKLPRRISQPNRREVIMLSSSTTNTNTSTIKQHYRMTMQQERELLDDIYDLLGYVWVISFILYHFVKFDATILTSTFDHIMTLMQFMIRVWIDFIRSARGW